MKILVTGGSGYIGSHTCLALLEAGYDVVVLDNLCNSSAKSLERVEKLANRQLQFIKGDIRSRDTLKKVFATNKISAVIHFAGLKAVGESVKEPLLYFSNNVAGTIALCEEMQNAGVFTLIFSSSCTVYGAPLYLPIPERHPTGNTTNPYGRSKFIAEQVLQDLSASCQEWKVALLRYFNPVGAHESGDIGEDPNGSPNNLLPYICRVAIGRIKHLEIFGNDYPTRDGTGVRDYIHVMDVAEAHVASLYALTSKAVKGINVWNLGTGSGYSVLEMVREFECVSGQSVPFKIMPRRRGDVPQTYADPSKVKMELGWNATRNLRLIMTDAWRWQSRNPSGYV